MHESGIKGVFSLANNVQFMFLFLNLVKLVTVLLFRCSIREPTCFKEHLNGAFNMFRCSG